LSLSGFSPDTLHKTSIRRPVPLFARRYFGTYLELILRVRIKLGVSKDTSTPHFNFQDGKVKEIKVRKLRKHIL
jgi:hypothetical protein